MSTLKVGIATYEDMKARTLAVARFYFARLLPETAMLIRQARSGAAPTVSFSKVSGSTEAVAAVAGGALAAASGSAKVAATVNRRTLPRNRWWITEPPFLFG